MIFIPVSCKHVDNFNFHSSLVSSWSHVNRALYTNYDSVSWDEIKELKDFISEQCLKARYINNERNSTNRATGPQLLQKSVKSHDTESQFVSQSFKIELNVSKTSVNIVL